MRLEELYSKYDKILNGLNVHPIQHCIFDLSDENSQNSLKSTFSGIESVIMPECGKYLVMTSLMEDPNCLLLLFPEQSDGNLSISAFNMKNGTSKQLMSNGENSEKITIDNFKDFANMEEIAKRFNEFAFNPNGENSTNEVKNIGSFDVSNDEPVEIKNTNADNEETEMKFKPINEEIMDDNETKWVEIPNSNAHQITVEDGEEETGDDPFAGDVPAGDAPAPEGGNAAPATDAAPADATPADGSNDANATPEETPAPEDTTPSIDDPKAKMRELLAYYTNYMNELVQDPNTSTELIAATQDMIDSLIKNMESADGIEEVKADAEEAAKEEASAEEAPAEETPVDSGDATASTEPVAEETEEENKVDDEQAKMDAKIDSEIDDLHKDDLEDIAPATYDNILTPGEQGMKMVDDVDLTGLAPTEDDELAATTPDMDSPSPTSDVLDDTTLPSPEEEVSLLGDDDYLMVGPDGLPLDKFDGDVDALASIPAAKKIAWSNDYATNGVATSDDNAIVVPEVLRELGGYYTKVADEVSKVPGKEDIAMKLQKIQVLTQTISNEWNSIITQIGGAVPSSFDRSNMGTLEKDELDSREAMGMVGADVMADQEQEEEDELAIQDEIASFVESFKHLI